MSHTFNMQTEIRDTAALRNACHRLNVRCEHGVHKLFQTEEIGHGVFLNDWRYPVVVKDGGELAYDNYNGQWGDEARLNELKAYYGIEKAKIEARKQGHSVYESYNDQTRELELKIAVGQ